MASPNLPQELQNSIIDHLYDDPQALKTASLVSRAWSQQARPLLFERKTVAVTISADTQNLVQLLKSSTSITGIFTLARYIKKLRIEGTGYGVKARSLRDICRTWASYTQHYTQLGQYLSELVPHLTAVTTLTVYRVHWDWLTAECRNPLSQFSSVETLIFDQVSFPNFSTGYEAIFGTVPTNKLKDMSLASLTAYNRTMEYPFPEDYHDVLQMLDSMTLNLDNCDETRHPLLIPLISAPCNLHTLNLIVTVEEHIDMINPVLKHIGSMLKVLIFGRPHSAYVYKGWVNEENTAPLTLSVASNPQLERLQLSGFKLPAMPYILNFLPNYLSGLLDSIRSTSLFELEFCVDSTQHVIDKLWTFDAVGRCLAQPLSPLDPILAEWKSVIPMIRILLEGELPTMSPRDRRTIARKAAECLPNLHQNNQIAISIGGYPVDFSESEVITSTRHFTGRLFQSA